MFDVHMYYHKESKSWTIDLRKTGCRKMLVRYDSTVPYSFIECQAISWADFIGATLTREPPAEALEEKQPC